MFDYVDIEISFKNKIYKMKMKEAPLVGDVIKIASKSTCFTCKVVSRRFEAFFPDPVDKEDLGKHNVFKWVIAATEFSETV